jgi:hypothetical protein
MQRMQRTLEVIAEGSNGLEKKQPSPHLDLYTRRVEPAIQNGLSNHAEECFFKIVSPRFSILSFIVTVSKLTPA